MMRQIKKLLILGMIVTLMNLLSGCGQTGPLYLPKPGQKIKKPKSTNTSNAKTAATNSSTKSS